MKRSSALLVILTLLCLILPQTAIGQSGRNRKSNPDSSNSQSDDQPTKSSSNTAANTPLPSNAPGSSKDAAGKSTPVEVGSGDEVNLSSTLVSIPLLVSDRTGRYLPGLSKNDFILYEDGIKQQVAFFSSEEVPFHVVLVIDTSGSTTESGRDIKNAAQAFVQQLHENDQVEVMSFASSVNIETRFTNDRQLLNQAIERIHWGGSTKLYEAVYQAVKTELHGIEGRKAIVLLTDGEDTTSHRVSYHQAIDAAVESGALIYVARYPSDPDQYGPMGPRGRRPNQWPGNPWPQPGTNPNGRPWPYHFELNWQNPPQPRSPLPGGGGQGGGRGGVWGHRAEGDFLTDLVDETGGDMFNANKYSDMQSVLSTVAEELRHIYVIGFYPSNPKLDGRYRKINIQVANNTNVVVKYKHGYNAPNQQDNSTTTGTGSSKSGSTQP